DDPLPATDLGLAGEALLDGSRQPALAAGRGLGQRTLAGALGKAAEPGVRPPAATPGGAEAARLVAADPDGGFQASVEKARGDAGRLAGDIGEGDPRRLAPQGIPQAGEGGPRPAVGDPVAARVVERARKGGG